MLWKLLLFLSFSYAISCEPTNAMTTSVAQAFRQYGSKTSIMTVKRDAKLFAVSNATKDLSVTLSQIAFPLRSQDPSHPSNTKFDGHNIPLIANSVEYMVDVDVGFPPQRVRVQVDTGSALFVIPSSKCTECDHHKSLYDPSKSQSSGIISCSDPECTSHQCDDNNRCAFQIKYGDGASFGGYLLRDLIGLGDSNNNSIYTVGHIGSVVSNPGGREAMGILGLAYNIKKLSCVPNCAMPYYDQLVMEGKVSNVFSLALTQTDTADGSLILGGIDRDIASSYSQQSAEDTIIYYTPVVEKSYYAVSLEDMYVGNVSVAVAKSKIPKTAVDSGTTLLILNSAMYQNIKNVFQSNYCDLPHICTDTNIFQYYTANSSVYKNCIDSQTIRPIFSKFPNITIILDGVALTLMPQDYMELTTASSGYQYYCFGIFDGGAKSLTILGDTFMKAFYVVFDRESNRVGFVGRPGTIQAVPMISDKPSWLWVFGAVMLLVLAAITVVYAVVMLVLFIRKRKAYGYQLLTQEQDSEVSQIELSL